MTDTQGLTQGLLSPEALDAYEVQSLGIRLRA